MPEGHTIHRAARDQRPHLVGRRLSVSSPQGRFAEGAEALDGRTCESVEAYGKHLLYGFEGGRSLHLHLGLYGRFHAARGPSPEPRGAVRVRLATLDYTVDCNGPAACEALDPPERARLLLRIGPDLLRADADAERAWARIHRSRTPLGVLLMDQSVLSGIGNIYRTELLWRARLHPLLPGRDFPRPAFDALWDDARRLLEIGVETGAIVTVEAGSKAARRPFRDRVEIMRKADCPRCGGPVRELDMAGRRAFVCERCAPAPDTSAPVADAG